MKHVFGYNAETGELDGKGLMYREMKESLSKRQDELVEAGNKQEEQASLPSWLENVKIIAKFFMIVTLCGSVSGILKALTDGKHFVEIAKNGWWIWLIAGISTAIFLIIHFISKKKVKAVVESEEFNLVEKRSERLYKEIMEDLKVPQDAPQTDLLIHSYKLSKNGKKRNAGLLSVYYNLQFHVYKEEDKLCFADVGTVYGVPMDGLKRIVKINKLATFPNWNKEERYNEGEYKKYKINTNNYGTLFVKPYYSLQFVADNEEFELLFPPYELETIQKITGLSVEGEEE